MEPGSNVSALFIIMSPLRGFLGRFALRGNTSYFLPLILLYLALIGFVHSFKIMIIT
jgi:hypothetical protein